MLIEGLGSISLANGVMRIETLYRNAKGEDQPGPDLLIPGNRAGAILQGLEAMIKKVHDAVEAQRGDASEVDAAQVN